MIYLDLRKSNPKITVTNEFDKDTVYTLDSVWGVIKSVILPDGTVVTDEYDDDMCAKLKRSFGNGAQSNSFAYSAGNLSKMQTGSLYYDFAYSKDKLSSVSKNGTKIEEHEITDTQANSYYPSKTSNIYSDKVTFDKYGRLVSVDGVLTNTYDVAPSYMSDVYEISGQDNASGKLATSTDLKTGNVTKYAYENNRLSRVGIFNSSATKVNEESFAYDKAGRVTADTFTYNNNLNTARRDIAYVTEENSLTADSRVLSCSYKVNGVEKAKTQNRYNDNYKRLTAKLTTIGSYTYDKGFTYNNSRITKVMDVKNGSTLHNVSYGYDSMGRIVSEVDSTDTNINNTYAYDSFGQLIRENNKKLDKTIVYSYNGIGNITSAKTYAYTTSATPTGSYTEETYTYGNSIHTDRLTKYNGTSISYNTVGCVSSYNGWTHGWSKGKLSYLKKTSSARVVPLASNTKTYSFSYNSLGQRTLMRYSYVVSNSSTPLQDGELTDYTKKFDYDNAGRLIHEKNTKTLTTTGTKYTEITYLYDENEIIGMIYGTSSSSPATYYFLRNLQGDVIAIYNTSGTRVVEYAYDAYGNCTVIYAQNTELAENNPIRYRGYYFDVDTGLYYLNARYYNPQWRRFISPDSTEYLDPDSVNGLNLYAYCGNDPVNYADPSGHMPEWTKWLIGGLVIAGLTIATIATGGAAGGVAGFILAGALKGAVLGAVSGALVSGVIGGVSSTMTGDGFWDGFTTGASSGFMSGAIIGGITGAISSGVQVYNASKLWANTGNKTAYKQMVDHYQHHVINEGQKAIAKNIVNYSKDAYQFFQSNSLNAQIINAQLGVVKISGAPGGIYNLNGLIRSFWYILK